MSINIYGKLHAATVEGVLAEASQVSTKQGDSVQRALDKLPGEMQQAGDARYLRKDISDESRGTLTAQVLAVHGRTDAGSTGDKSVIYLDPHTGALKHDTITQTAEGQRHANCELLDESSFMTDEEWDAELRSIGI